VAGLFTQGTGGRFTGSKGTGAAKGTALSPGAAAQAATQVPPALASAFAAQGGSLSYDPKANRGSGYGRQGGSPLVRVLQLALNRAGLTDSRGRPLAVDGKLGPLTTAAVKAAQRRLGVKQDGKVTPELLTQILGMPAVPPAKRPGARDRMRSHKPSKRITKKPPKGSGGGEAHHACRHGPHARGLARSSQMSVVARCATKGPKGHSCSTHDRCQAR
jgi:hypothetical protein